MEGGAVLPHARASGEALPQPETHGTAPDSLDRQMESTPVTDRVALLVQYLAAQTASDSLGWIAELAARAERYGFPVAQTRYAATDLSWMARMSGQRYPGATEWDHAGGSAGSSLDRLVLAYVHGQRLRFDYKFLQLRTHCNKWLKEFSDDALILGLAAFAGLGSGASNGLDLFHRAIDSPNADEKTRQVCLGALEWADYLDEQAETLLSLSNDMMSRGEDNENVRYRRATALRKLGRYDEALAEIDRALEVFDAAGRTLVHEQYSQERRAIIAARDVRRQAEKITRELGERISAQLDQRVAGATSNLEAKIAEASELLGQRVDTAQEMLSDGLLKSVEILGLFVTLLGFIVGSGAVVVKARTFWERAGAIALVVIGSLVFFTMLRLVISFRRKR